MLSASVGFFLFSIAKSLRSVYSYWISHFIAERTFIFHTPLLLGGGGGRLFISRLGVLNNMHAMEWQ